MNDPKLIKSLAIAWPTLEKDYLYAVAVLKQLGRRPEFNQSPNYLRLWAWVNAGELLGENVTQWQPMLTAETERLRRHQAEFEKETAKCNAKIAELNQRRQALLAAEAEVSAALSQRLGY